MPPVKPSKKPNTGTPGVKMLITAASLAATVGGWALISAKETAPAPAVRPPAAAPVLSVKLAPLPTLVPAMAGQSQLVTVNNQRAAQPAVVASQAAPQAAPQPALVLRDVSAPVSGGPSAGPAAGAPPPAANTGSSR